MDEQNDTMCAVSRTCTFQVGNIPSGRESVECREQSCVPQKEQQ